MVELAVVLAISAIVVGFAVPGFTELRASASTDHAVNRVVASFELARSEAVRRGVPVTVCRSADPAVARPRCDADARSGYAGNDWGAGWIVFAKRGPGPGPADRVDDEDVLVSRVAFGHEARGPRVVALSTAPRFSFDGEGFRGAGPLGLTLAVDYRNADEPAGQQLRCVRLSSLGRVRVERGRAGRC